MKNLLVNSLIILFSLGLVLSCSNNTNTSNNLDDKNGSNDSTQNETEKSYTEEVIIQPDKIKNGDIVNNLSVENYIFEKGSTFGFTLKGGFEVCGDIMIDEMWDELAIQINEDSNPHNNLMFEYDGFKTKLIQFCYISNASELKKQLSEEELEKLQNKESISVCLSVKDFSIGGKIGGYTESRIDFVEIKK